MSRLPTGSRPQVECGVVNDAPIRELAERLNEPSVTVLTGAGVSAASGVPTFRGAGGLWRQHRPEDLATPEAFARDPELVWEWYDWRRQLVARCEPNPAHMVIAAWSRAFERFVLVTQNVDGLHERAGTQHTLRFHGSIWDLQCWRQCGRTLTRWEDRTTPLLERPPRCPACGDLARPGVVWFGEPIDPAVLERSIEATACDVFLTVGTSALVHPAAALVARAKDLGAFTAEINLEPTPASDFVDLTVHGPAEEILVAVEHARST